MSYANGQLPASMLAPLAGNPGKLLRLDAAAAFNAMARLRPVRVLDGYRPLGYPGDYAHGSWSQWYTWEKYRYHGGALAAVPGTSRHGWGLAIDLASCSVDRAVIDSIGARFGFSKGWSDAQGECWHICYRPGVWIPTTTSRGIARGSWSFDFATGRWQFERTHTPGSLCFTKRPLQASVELQCDMASGRIRWKPLPRNAPPLGG